MMYEDEQKFTIGFSLIGQVTAKMTGIPKDDGGLCDSNLKESVYEIYGIRIRTVMDEGGQLISKNPTDAGWNYMELEN